MENSSDQSLDEIEKIHSNFIDNVKQQPDKSNTFIIYGSINRPYHFFHFYIRLFAEIAPRFKWNFRPTYSDQREIRFKVLLWFDKSVRTTKSIVKHVNRFFLLNDEVSESNFWTPFTFFNIVVEKFIDTWEDAQKLETFTSHNHHVFDP